MKMVDFACKHCRTRFEVVEPSGGRVKPYHCGTRARRLVSAPALVGVRTQYRHALGREANNRELEKAVEAKGGYIPSMAEVNMVKEMSENKVLPEYFGKPNTEAQVAKAADKAFDRYMKEKSQGMHREDP